MKEKLLELMQTGKPPLNIPLFVYWNKSWFIGRVEDLYGGVVFYEEATGWGGIAITGDFRWLILPNEKDGALDGEESVSAGEG